MQNQKESFKQAFTFDDLLLMPGYTDFSRSQIDLSARLTKKIELKIPLVSSPMDTVTESRLAIALGKLGGIGIIHRNLTIKEQIKEVIKVKKEDLLVGAAIGANQGFEERVRALVNKDCDVIVVDSAHGFCKNVIDTTKWIKKNFPKIQIIAGNVASYEGAVSLIRAGADGLRVGMGPGAICSTRIISGMGVPQITAIGDCDKASQKKKIPIIADGGIRYSGDIVKALAAGASTVMIGSLFAAAQESPGKVKNLTRKEVPSRFLSIFNHQKQVVQFKEYRGMGSEGAMREGARVKSENEFHNKNYRNRALVAEGVEGLVPIKGTLRDIAEQLVGGIRSGMYYVGAKNIQELWQKVQFIQITPASLSESHPHDLLITNSGESYR